MKYLMISLLFSILSLNCSKDNEFCLPVCILNKIEILSEHNCDETANITRYRFQHSKVYVIDPGNCAIDQSYEVINSQCEVIGHLWGFAGNTEIDGVDFFENAKLLDVVWKK